MPEREEVWEALLEKLIVDPDYEWLMINASHIKIHPHGSRGLKEKTKKWITQKGT